MMILVTEPCEQISRFIDNLCPACEKWRKEKRLAFGETLLCPLCNASLLARLQLTCGACIVFSAHKNGLPADKVDSKLKL